MTISTQHLIDKVRKPRVHITYDVQIGDAIEKKELPFVVGILADLSGSPKTLLPRLKDRKFVYIDQDNMDDVFAAATPCIKFDVKNVINPTPDGNNMMHIELNMKSIKDFSPLSLVQRIPELANIYEERVLIKDLLAKTEGNELLLDILKLIIEDDDTRNSLKQIVQTMKAQLEPKADAAAEAQAAKDAAIDEEVKAEIQAAEKRRKAKKAAPAGGADGGAAGAAPAAGAAGGDAAGGTAANPVDTKDKDKS